MLESVLTANDDIPIVSLICLTLPKKKVILVHYVSKACIKFIEPPGR